jgi:hypothetical protein
MLTAQQKESILSEFPQNLKLSYENVVHKKVSNFTFVSAIPQGKKSFAWFTYRNNEPICYLLELEKNKQIAEINIIHTSFQSSLASLPYGTILYGTLFHQKGQAFYTVEDICYYKGKNVSFNTWLQKLEIMKTIFTKNEIKQCAYNKRFTVFGLPVMQTDCEKLLNQLKQLPYKVYCLQYRNMDKNGVVSNLPMRFYSEALNDFLPGPSYTNTNTNTNTKTSVSQPTQNQFIPLNQQRQQTKIYPTKNITKREIVFKIKADIQNDIYHLYCTNGTDNEYYYDIASIPDYKTSLYMNRLFRNIKENENLDALEESDDEEEFENEKEDRYVFLDREYLMICSYHYKFKKWVPLRIVPETGKPIPVDYKELMVLEKK